MATGPSASRLVAARLASASASATPGAAPCATAGRGLVRGGGGACRPPGSGSARSCASVAALLFREEANLGGTCRASSHAVEMSGARAKPSATRPPIFPPASAPPAAAGRSLALSQPAAASAMSSFMAGGYAAASLASPRPAASRPCASSACFSIPCGQPSASSAPSCAHPAECSSVVHFCERPPSAHCAKVRRLAPVALSSSRIGVLSHSGAWSE